MTNDIENISTAVSRPLPALFPGVLTVIDTMAVMLWYCWQLALLSFVTLLLTFLATKMPSDLIVAMERGEIAESGSYEELLAKKGRDYEFYMTRYAGFAT